MERDSLSEQNVWLSSLERSSREQNRVLAARLQALESATSDLCWITTSEGYFFAEQDSWKRFTGQSLEIAIGKGWLEAIHPADRDRLELVHTQCVRTKQTNSLRCLLRNGQGQYQHLSLCCIPVLNEADRVREVMYLGSMLAPNCQNTTTWLQQVGMEHLEARLIDMAHDAILVCDPADGRILSWNQGAAKLYGYSAEDAVGRLAPDLFQTRFPGSQKEFFDALIREGRWEGELGHLCRNGRIVTVEARFVLMRSDDGQPLAILEVSRDITERKQMEEQLKDYIQLAETAGQIGLWTWEFAQDKHISTSFDESIFPGLFPTGPVNYEAFLQKVHPDDREATDQAIHEALEQKIDYINEYRVLHPELGILWHLAYGRGVYDEQGKPIRLVGVVLNITERKRIEQELHDANEKVMSILESITDTFMYLDEEWRYIYVNSQACYYIGRTREELLGHVFWDMSPNASGTVLEQSFREAMEKKKVVLFDTYDSRTGRWFFIRVHPAKGGLTVFGSDITERIQIEEALRKSEAKFRRLVEANISAVAVANSEGLVSEANDAYLKMVEYTQEELEQGKVNWHDLTPPEYYEEDRRALQELHETGVCQPFEKEYITKHGKRVPILIAAATIEGNAEKYIVFAVDITPQKELEKQREHFFRLVSHELRTPLTAINGSLQLAQRRLARAGKKISVPTAAFEEAFGKVEETLVQSLRQTHVLNRLIDDLVESARVSVEKLSLSLEPYNLVEIVRDTVDDMRFTMPERAILLEDLPQEISVLADAGRISQVLANFISNALKYSPHEKPIVVGMTLEEQQARVWVRDWGPGLSPEDQVRVWERYFQGKGVADREVKSVNLGLGLHLCRLLVRQHNGKIGVESQLGEGSTFWFALPLLDDDGQA
jgi:PAS domain S-box-containing protein